MNDKAKRDMAYRKANVKTIYLDFSKKYDAAILDYLDKQPNKTDYIRKLILKDILYKQAD